MFDDCINSDSLVVHAKDQVDDIASGTSIEYSLVSVSLRYPKVIRKPVYSQNSAFESRIALDRSATLCLSRSAKTRIIFRSACPTMLDVLNCFVRLIKVILNTCTL